MTFGEQGLPLLWEESFLEAIIADALTLRVTSMTAFISLPSMVFMKKEATPTPPERWSRLGRCYRHSFLFPVAMPYRHCWWFLGAIEEILSVQSRSPCCKNKVGLEANSECASTVTSSKGLSGENGMSWHHGRTNQRHLPWRNSNRLFSGNYHHHQSNYSLHPQYCSRLVEKPKSYK